MVNRLEIAKDFVNAINSKYIKRVILFGSVARGEDTDDSDIDILIISDYEEEIDDKLADEIFDVVLEKEELISAYVMSEMEFNKTKHFSFLRNVLKDGIELI